MRIWSEEAVKREERHGLNPAAAAPATRAARATAASSHSLSTQRPQRRRDAQRKTESSCKKEDAEALTPGRTAIEFIEFSPWRTATILEVHLN
jgi:hypothetical protein